jgi:MSHA biogenesis protein MshP
MRPDFRWPRHAQGFGLVAAMFLLIVVTLVVIAMARLSAAQHGSNSLAIQQARAYQAARAGLEWGINQAMKTGNCVAGAPDLSANNLAGFHLGVTCSSNSYLDNDGSTSRIFRFTSTAQNGTPGSRFDYAYRQLAATLEKKMP